MPSTTLTIRLAPEVKERLGRLAASTHRSKSFLAAEAVARYVEEEAAVILGIEQGLADAEAGRLVPHDEAMARLEATIAAAERGKR
jgi:predicted transcriptional regulator